MARIQLNTPDWTAEPRPSRGGGSQRSRAADQGFPPEFLTPQSSVTDELTLQPAVARTRGLRAPGPLDLSVTLAPGESAVLALRHPSGALTFHPPSAPPAAATRGARGTNEVRFVVAVREGAGPGTRGLATTVLKATVIKVASIAADKLTSAAIRRLAGVIEAAAFKKRGLQEGWLRVTRESLAARKLEPAVPSSPGRTLLFLHGTFSNAASAFQGLASSNFFDRVAPLYGDRIFAFDHFTLSRTPEENARMLLEALPARVGPIFDVITHSRGGLVLRNLVERSSVFGQAARRFKVGRAVLVASPNGGTPLATPDRWDRTIGWVANLLELFPDNPFTTGAEFVANGIVWLARHASVDLPGLHAMDGDGDLIEALQAPPGPPADCYSALVANYQPSGSVLQRMLDVGVDQFFATANDLVVPSAGGWQIDAGGGTFIGGTRIGCFGPGGNIDGDNVTHVGFFSRPETVDFLVAELSGKAGSLAAIDPAKPLPQRALLAHAAASELRVRRSIDGAAERARQTAPAGEEPAALKITIVNGDLTFEKAPLLVGHYRATVLTGTERVMDRVLGGAMKHSLDLGVYPLAPGTHQIFLNTRLDPESPRRLPRPQAVIVAGLGEEGKLRSTDLVTTVRQAVIAWAQRESERGAGTELVLAATLVGSGGTGVNPTQAAQSVAQGVAEANAILYRNADVRRWPTVVTLRLIELYRDRAFEAWRALKILAEASPQRFEVADVVESGAGALPRVLDSGYRGADYDFIAVESKDLPTGESEISYTLDTRRARAEVRAQRTQSRLLRDLIQTASNDRNQDPLIGRTLFKLLVPIEMEPYLASTAEMQIELDGGTAGIPWELLDTDAEDRDGADRLPWAIRAKLLRKLKTADFRPSVADADAEASVLVIGEPACPPEYPRLSGARAEAREVCTLLSAPPDGLDPQRIRSLIGSDEVNVAGPDARTVINTLLERDWRIVHIAGHGALPEGAAVGGVVLSNGAFLGPNEIHTMRVVPELVFVNCCHLAARDIDQALTTDVALSPFSRPKFAAGVAERLIQIGVRCVIAAGWAVDDDAAAIFATTFYRGLLDGLRFIDAVAQARAAAYEAGGNTWAAYQCYGDPDWVLRRTVPDGQRPSSPAPKALTIASPDALTLALETIRVETTFQHAQAGAQQQRIAALEKEYGARYSRLGTVAEAFGKAYLAVRDVERAIEWFERALAANDASASMKAMEQYGNLISRRAWERVEAAEQRRQTSDAAATPVGGGKGGGRRRKSAGDNDKAVLAEIERARKTIADAAAFLDVVLRVRPTVERESVCGSAMKRLALVEAAATRHGQDRRAEMRQAIERMRAHYAEAQRLAIETKAGDVFYPGMNYLAADLALHAGQAGWKGLPAETVALCQESLERRAADDPDFWSVVGLSELNIYRALSARRLAARLPAIQRELDDLAARVSAPWLWASVADNARFVLGPYIERVSAPAERKAAESLLASLAARGAGG